METWIVETVIKTLEDGHRYTSRDSSICPRCNLAGVGVVVVMVMVGSKAETVLSTSVCTHAASSHRAVTVTVRVLPFHHVNRVLPKAHSFFSS